MIWMTVGRASAWGFGNNVAGASPNDKTTLNQRPTLIGHSMGNILMTLNRTGPEQCRSGFGSAGWFASGMIKNITKMRPRLDVLQPILFRVGGTFHRAPMGEQGTTPKRRKRSTGQNWVTAPALTAWDLAGGQRNPVTVALDRPCWPLSL